MARIDNGHNGFVIAPKLNTFSREMREPDCACHHYGKKFLPFDAYTPNPVKLHVRGPPTLESLPIEIAPKTNGARGVGVQFEIGRRGNGGL